MPGPILWGGADASGNQTANNLENAVRFSNGGGPAVIAPASPVNPTSVATFGNKGDLYLNNSTAVAYIKNDSGTTTNWSALSTTSASSLSPTVQVFTSQGTPFTGYALSFASAVSVTAGAVYSNNGHNYTLLNTLSSSTGPAIFTGGHFTLSGTTFTLVSGTGPSTLTYNSTSPISTYTTPSNPAPLYIEVEMVGGGGGGGGVNSGTAGTYTLFDALAICEGGSPGNPAGSSAGSGGSATVNSPAVQINNITGGSGDGDQATATIGSGMAFGLSGGSGGSTPFGGAGGGGSGGGGSGGGYSASTNSGSGGGGGGSNAGAGSSCAAGSGAGAGGYAKFQINSPNATYVYVIGSGGAGGSGNGTTVGTGGNGANGQIIVREYYQ